MPVCVSMLARNSVAAVVDQQLTSLATWSWCQIETPSPKRAALCSLQGKRERRHRVSEGVPGQRLLLSCPNGGVSV